MVSGKSAEVFRVKFPSKSATAPVLDPTTITFAPGIASLFSESTTVPEMFVCARTTFAEKNSNVKSPLSNTFFVFIFFVFSCFRT